MSRRKQSHPKPIKRLPGDESIDKELEDELEAKKIDNIKKEEILPMPAHSSCNEEMDVDPEGVSQSTSPDPTPDSSPRTFDKSGTRTFNDYENVHIKSERTSSRNSCFEGSPKTENDVLSTPPQPPPPPPPPPPAPPHPAASMPPGTSVTSTKCEILRLVKSADDELQVCCTIPLAKGSCLGPFYGDVTDEDAPDTLLEFTEDNGNTVYVRLLEESASWLKLLSKQEEAPKNCTVFYEAGRIWCRLTVDLTPESALAASFTFLSDQGQSPKAASTSEKEKTPTVGTGSGMPTSNAAATPIKREEADTSKHAISLAGTNTEIPVFSALIYQCPYCGVRFSKPSTLEGHLLYYCSKKPPPSSSSNILTPNEAGSNNTTPTTNVKKRERNSSTGSDDETSKKIRLESEQPVSEADESDTCTESGSPLPKAIKTGQLYQCPCCSYSAEKLSGLNRHRRIHNRPTKDSQETTPKSVLKSDTFCKECNIQFSSSNTYRGHKKFYCARRNKEVSREGSPVAASKPDVEVQSPVNSLTPVSHHLPNIPFHVTANSSSVLSTQAAVIVAAPIMTPNGVPSLAFTVPTVIVQPVVSSASLTQPAQAHQTAIPLSSSSKDQPLDLSTKKDEGKGNEKSATTQVSPAISETSEVRNNVKEEPVDALTTERKSVSENSSSSSVTPATAPTAAASSGGATWPTVETSVLNQLFNHNINQYPHQPKQILTSPTGQTPATTSVSKCLECNIVFYKHENFVAHKQHYCASRRAVKTSPQISPKLSPRETDTASSTAATVAAVAASSLRKPSPELTSRPLSSSASNEEKVDAINNVSKMAAIPNETVEKNKTNVSYFCVPCKIKFSSASTLKAHKDYYCPHGKNSEQSLILCKNDSVSEGSCSEADDNSLEDNFYTCTNCCTSYTSSRLYRHHYCPANMQNPMVRCPHCDYVAPTQNKLSEHMKAHATSRGYKCLLCGYRGNTVRGMRMHGKTHTDSGQEFSEKHVLEVEEPPVLPVAYKNGTTDTYGSMDVEAELIRLKNEPYKRRRSRKSYERMDIPNHELLHACKICGETFTDLCAFQIHSTIHQTSQIVSHAIGRPKSVINGKQVDENQPSSDLAIANKVEQSVSSTLSATLATTTSRSSTSIYPINESMDSKASLKYITEKMDPKLTQNAKQTSPTSNAGTTTPPSATAMHFKYETDPDPKVNNPNVSPTLLHRFQDAESPRPAATSATISGATPTDLEKTVNSLGTVIHIKPEPVDRGYDKAENGTASVDSPPLATTSVEINVKKEIDQSSSCERKEVMIPQSSPQEGPKVLSHSKLEIPSHSRSPPSSSLLIPPSSSSSPLPSSPSSSSQTAASTAFSTSTSASAAAAATAASSNTTPLYVYNSQYLQGERTDPSNNMAEPQLSKYCQQCDISFTYLATFLAHKKHYCSARLPDNKPSVTA